MANQFIYTTNEKLGLVMMVEGEDRTTNMHRVKVEDKPFHTLPVQWWDKDLINKMVGKNEKSIIADQRHFILNGVYGLIDQLAEEFSQLDKVQKTAVISELNDRIKM